MSPNPFLDTALPPNTRPVEESSNAMYSTLQRASPSSSTQDRHEYLLSVLDEAIAISSHLDEMLGISRDNSFEELSSITCDPQDKPPKDDMKDMKQ
jgi:hypothetical protein